MAVQRWLILDADGVAQNVTLWDADADPDWSPPEGFTVRPDDGTTPTTAPPEALPTADERLAALEDELRDVKGRLAAAERRKP
jgi:hypothetical protein